jgi:DNA-binding MarR family transcriptional regulator
LAFEVDQAFRAMHSAVGAFVDAAAERFGINRNDQRCLEILERLGPLTAGQLAGAAALSAAAVTKIVDRLVAAGYVVRDADDTDRRRVVIRTTDVERELQREVFAPLVREGLALFTELTDEQLRFLLTVVRRATAINEAHTRRLRATTDVAQPPVEA